MHIQRSYLPRLFVVAAVMTSLGVGVGGVASATTEPPTDTSSMDSEVPSDGGGSALADVSAFCAAEVVAEAAFFGGDPEAIGPAAEALVAAAPPEIAPTVQEVLATAENPDSRESTEAYAALIDYVKANCGFRELAVVAQDHSFGGVPEEVPAGPTVLTLENIGEEAHEFIVFRINDDVTIPVEEIFAFPQDAAEMMVTEVGGPFALPGGTGHTVLELTPGRHVALCFVLQGTTAEVIEQEMAAAEGSDAEGSGPVGSGSGAAAVDTATMGSDPFDASAPGAEGGPPHFMLGMIQEFQVS